MKRRLLRTVTCLVCLMGFVAPATSAQVGWGLSGVVRDTTGAALPGATVTVVGADLPAGRSAVTNKDGRYELDELPAGRYVVEAALPGFGPTAVGVAIDGRSATQDLVLGVSSLSERITRYRDKGRRR